MLADVVFHLFLEGTGGLALKCALGLCSHVEHKRRRFAVQAATWSLIAVPMSFITVTLVG